MADLSLDREMLQDVNAREKWEALRLAYQNETRSILRKLVVRPTLT